MLETVGLIFNLNIFDPLPSMPYFVALIFAAMLLALAVLVAVGTVYVWLYPRQLLRSYLRWNRITVAAARGGAQLLDIPTYPQASAVTKRRLRKINLASLEGGMT